MSTYCWNDPCCTEAIYILEWADGSITPLCGTCFHAFEMGVTAQQQGNWDIRTLEQYISAVQDMGLDAEIELTEEEAQKIINESWKYGNPLKTLACTLKDILEDREYTAADLAYDLARDK